MWAPMSRVAVIGEAGRIRSFALAGVATHPAENGEEVRSAWRRLGDDVTVVILTPQAADCLASLLKQRPRVLTVVMPS
jgi:vacuolar-type H+-ATPase subunit F/Vma7